ncbi:MAG: hypothetical protein ACI4MS_04560 [Candidatus Coproplasma sp.]
MAKILWEEERQRSKVCLWFKQRHLSEVCLDELVSMKRDLLGFSVNMRRISALQSVPPWSFVSMQTPCGGTPAP